MDNAVKVALIVGAAIVIFLLFFQRPSSSPSPRKEVTFQVPLTGSDGSVQAFVSPSGGASVEFVPSTDGERVYADYA